MSVQTPISPVANPEARANAVAIQTGSAAASLRAVLAFTFLNSIGSAVVYSGIYFIAESAYAFGRTDKYLLALVYGITYIPGAVAIGPLLRRLERGAGTGRAGGARLISPRTVLAFIMIAMAVLCFIPPLVTANTASQLNGAARSSWPVWVLVGLYSPLSGAMWPMIEAFVSGGRSGSTLRSAVGRFNISWSSAIVVGLLAIVPLVEKHPFEILTALGVVQALTALVLLGFPARPAAHIHEHHEPHPPVYRQLLGLLRVLLPTTFLVLAALSPYLPSARAALGFDLAWGPVLAAAWMTARVVTFATMERWHGWHGRWSIPLLGISILMAAFAVVVLAPTYAGPSLGRPLLMTGLAGFGVGVGIVYTAALYYAMEVGSADVDAAGVHETLIGVGYTLGPLCGLIASGLAHGGQIQPGHVEPVMLALVSVCAVAGLVIAIKVARRATAKS